MSMVAEADNYSGGFEAGIDSLCGEYCQWHSERIRCRQKNISQKKRRLHSVHELGQPLDSIKWFGYFLDTMKNKISYWLHNYLYSIQYVSTF